MHACFVNAMFGKRGADESFKATLGQHHWEELVHIEQR